MRRISSTKRISMRSTRALTKNATENSTKKYGTLLKEYAVLLYFDYLSAIAFLTFSAIFLASRP